MKNEEIPVVQFKVDNIDVQFNISTGEFRIFARPKDEYLKTLKMDRRLGVTYWDDPDSSIRIGAYNSKEYEDRFVNPDKADHWICFANERLDFVKLLNKAF